MNHSTDTGSAEASIHSNTVVSENLSSNMGCGGVLFAMCSRFQVLLLSSAAIGGSLVTTFSCQFFTYQALNGEAWAGLEGPFQDLPEASVGLFSYSESIASTDALGASCERYNDWKYVGQSRLFQVAQIASMCAPILAFLAWVQILVEFLCCRLYGGLCLMSTLFLLAAGAQACTFLMLADKQFCLEPESVNECSLELGSYYSFGAMILYIVLSCLVSNTPASPGQRIQGCMVYTGWKAEPGPHPRVISTPANTDPEMARSVEPKDIEPLNKLPPEQAPNQQRTSAPPEAFRDEEAGKGEIIEEEVLVVEDENGQQVVVEEEEIVEDSNHGEQDVMMEEEIIEEDADGNQLVVEEEVVEEEQPVDPPEV